MMIKHKYYQASVDDDSLAVVEATSPGQAKYKYIQGTVVPWFQGYDNLECDFTDVRVQRLKELDKFEPDDDFNILKTLIIKYGWTFRDVDGCYCLDDENYGDSNLKRYLEYGKIEKQEG